MLQQNVFFLFLLGLGVLVCTYFSIETATSLSHYFALKASAPAHILRWEIKEVKGKFPITAHYSFQTQDTIWQGASTLSKPWHLNEMAAATAVKTKAKEKLNVFFSPQNPLKSGLEKIFPTNLMIRTILCYAVLGYFFILIGHRHWHWHRHG